MFIQSLFRNWLFKMIYTNQTLCLSHPYSAPSHYLNQYWVIVNWTLRNKPQWISIKLQKFSITKMHLNTCILSAKWRPGSLKVISISCFPYNNHMQQCNESGNSMDSLSGHVLKLPGAHLTNHLSNQYVLHIFLSLFYCMYIMLINASLLQAFF